MHDKDLKKPKMQNRVRDFGQVFYSDVLKKYVVALKPAYHNFDTCYKLCIYYETERLLDYKELVSVENERGECHIKESELPYFKELRATSLFLDAVIKHAL